MSTFCRPLCPRCKTTTMLARITPGSSGFDIETFECLACRHVHQRVVALGDPMKSRAIAGWLRGELQPPTWRGAAEGASSKRGLDIESNRFQRFFI